MPTTRSHRHRHISRSLAPFSDLAGLRERFDQLLEVADGGNGGSFSLWVDVVEEEGKIVLKVDLPGIKPEYALTW